LYKDKVLPVLKHIGNRIKLHYWPYEYQDRPTDDYFESVVAGPDESERNARNWFLSALFVPSTPEDAARAHKRYMAGLELVLSRNFKRWHQMRQDRPEFASIDDCADFAWIKVRIRNEHIRNAAQSYALLLCYRGLIGTAGATELRRYISDMTLQLKDRVDGEIARKRWIEKPWLAFEGYTGWPDQRYKLTEACELFAELLLVAEVDTGIVAPRWRELARYDRLLQRDGVWPAIPPRFPILTRGPECSAEIPAGEVMTEPATIPPVLLIASNPQAQTEQEEMPPDDDPFAKPDRRKFAIDCGVKRYKSVNGVAAACAVSRGQLNDWKLYRVQTKSGLSDVATRIEKVLLTVLI
jgi:hypothetical protein